MSDVELEFSWAVRQLVRLHLLRPELVDAAIGRLIQVDEELRWSLVVNAYRDGQINLGKAAELLGMHELELRERFIRLGIPLRIGPVDLAEAQAEVAALETWLAAVASDTHS